MPILTWLSTARKRLPSSFLLVGMACALSTAIQAEPRVDAFELDTFSEVTDRSDFPYFKEVYYFPLKTELITNAADELLVLRDFFTVNDLVSHGEDPDDLSDDEYESLNVATFTAYSEKVAARPEMGLLGFKFAEDDISVGTSQAVGFIRKSRHIKDLPATKMDGLLVGAHGSIEWSPLDYSRQTTVDLNYSIGGTDYSRVVDSSYVLYSNSLTLSSLTFPVTDEVDSYDWIVSSVNLDHLGDGEFYGLARRNDYLTQEDLEGIIPDGVDPDTIWNQLYILRFFSPHDADRDHLPDILDQTGSVPTYPWYADIATYTDWYWSHWLGLWIYSDRLSDWDFWQYLGWTYVSDSGTRDAFWFYAPSLSDGWLLSSEGLYPTIYDTSSGDYLYVVIIDDMTGYVYSYADDSWSLVNP